MQGFQKRHANKLHLSRMGSDGCIQSTNQVAMCQKPKAKSQKPLLMAALPDLLSFFFSYSCRPAGRTRLTHSAREQREVFLGLKHFLFQVTCINIIDLKVFSLYFQINQATGSMRCRQQLKILKIILLNARVLKDYDMLQRLNEIEKIDMEDKNHILYAID